LLIQPQPRDSAKGARLKEFLTWMLQPEAQRMAADLHYAPLPVPVIELVQKRIAG
jgi:ABC-type phosphate transport system substrate-binding protein